MDYFFNEDQMMIKELVQQIAEEKIKPVREELDEKEEFPREILKVLADTDMFRVFVPEEYGGIGGGCLDLCLVVEELSRVCSGVAISYAAVALGAIPMLLYGTEEQKRKYLVPLAQGSASEMRKSTKLGRVKPMALPSKNSRLQMVFSLRKYLASPTCSSVRNS